jgi:hypothetical protein
MDWLALPFTSTELKKKLDERCNVSGVPTVIMLKRETNADGRGDGAFVMLPDGANGRTLLSQPPGKLVADFPWGTEDRIVQPLQAELHAIEQNLSLVVLCEHLTPSQSQITSRRCCPRWSRWRGRGPAGRRCSMVNGPTSSF